MKKKTGQRTEEENQTKRNIVTNKNSKAKKTIEIKKKKEFIVKKIDGKWRIILNEEWEEDSDLPEAEEVKKIRLNKKRSTYYSRRLLKI